MEAGKSPIVDAIAQAESGTTGEIHVHLSRRWIDRDPLGRAKRLFDEFGLSKTTHRNAILLYVNLRLKRMSIYGDQGIHERVGAEYWERILRDLTGTLRTTHHERAIAEAVLQVGIVLKRHFPLAPGEAHHDELSNEVTRD